MALPENRSPEPTAVGAAAIEQGPPTDTVIADSGNSATLTASSDIDTRDPDEVTPEDEPASDIAGDDTIDGASEEDGETDAGSSHDAGKDTGHENEDKQNSDEVSKGEPVFPDSANRYQDEQFETYKLKVAQLCRDLEFGEPLEIEEMRAGGFNKIVGLTLPGRPKLILRVSHFMDEDDSDDFLDQVSITSYFSRFEFLHAPKIVAFDSTEDNALGSLYVLQQRLPGIPAADVFYTLPLAEKLQITTLVAETLTKLEAMRLDKPGRLAGTGSLPCKLDGEFPPLEEIQVSPYRHNPITPFPPVEQQSLPNYFATLLEIQKRHDEVVAPKCDRLMEIAKQMESAGLMRTTDTQNVPWHWDFSGGNVIIYKEETTKSSSIEDASSAACQHKAEIKMGDDDMQGPRHTIQVEVEDNSGRSCSHKIEVSVEDSCGKKYRHTINITGGSNASNSDVAGNQGQLSLPNTIPKTQNTFSSTKGHWVLGGVIDWDDVLSVPLVLARKPPSWLWFNEEDRVWSQNRDDPLPRELTQDELLIKAYFDQLMEKASPGYIVDTYHRGVWLRRLARFALEGFNDGEAWKRYDVFVKEWSAYYSTLGKGVEDES